MTHEAALIAALVKSIKRIEELATDTPEPETYDEALNAIRAECEQAIAFAESVS
jgi:hypothetical protein